MRRSGAFCGPERGSDDDMNGVQVMRGVDASRVVVTLRGIDAQLGLRA